MAYLLRGYAVWTIEKIRSGLEKYDVWVLKGVVAIYRRQTGEEVIKKCTLVRNNIGFNAADAYYLSSIARDYLMGRQIGGCDIRECRRRMMKYAGQLCEIANITDK